MPWKPLAERFDTLPLILAGPILRRTEPRAVTVWLALKEPRTVSLRIYAKADAGNLVERLCGTRSTVRLGDHLHVVAVTARTVVDDEQLAWGKLYYYDLFFQPASPSNTHVPITAAHLGTPGVLNTDPSLADALEQLVYPGHPLPSLVLPPEDINQLRIIHGSCRKPHGVGREMLSALDFILADSAQDAAHRPQQLFLTGDQVYADEVAKPLLSALIDAGNFLLTGNREEVLPLVHVPACMLAPGSRTDAVRNKARFTAQEPENHLVALAEFYAMYLFAWSDVLWPDDLPPPEDIHAYADAQPLSAEQQRERQKYSLAVEQLQAFRSALPQVRRALANIATYMICDDHDVTDDWFLDGVWCQRVLGSELGRHIVRNALLAYALFQAWGNTPDQFEEPKGAALLEAVDGWRGGELDTRATLINRAVGLPTVFDGHGTLQYVEQPLQWHYTFAGPRFQIIVMDTRTQRLYLTPHAFPGLLSPEALATQVVAAACEDVEVTLLVSATPVIGVSLLETIQLWSRKFNKENNSYDPEAWELERFTFQSFIKVVSAMKRVVILSGDVHYAFGSSLEYWNYHTKTTAKMINFTSSPLQNEGASTEIAALATGYPYFFRLLGRGEIPALDFFAWDTAAGSTGNTHLLHKMRAIVRSQIYKLWWSAARLIDLQRSSYALVLPAQGWPRGAFAALPPDRSYRLRYLHDMRYRANIREPVAAVSEGAKPGKARNTTMGQTMSSQQPQGSPIGRVNSLLQRVVQGAHLLKHEAELLEHEVERDETLLADAFLHYKDWLMRWEAGMLIVGHANIGEICFEWTPEKKEALQRLWWWHPTNPERATPATEYRDTLDLPAFDAAPRLP